MLIGVRVLDRSLSRLPRPLRTSIDWAVTITFAAVGVLVFQAEVAKPYRIPTSSMEPTLHCAKPADGCRSRVSDRVIANRIVYRFQAPRQVLRLAPLGRRHERQHHRPSRHPVLAAKSGG